MVPEDHGAAHVDKGRMVRFDDRLICQEIIPIGDVVAVVEVVLIVQLGERILRRRQIHHDPALVHGTVVDVQRAIVVILPGQRIVRAYRVAGTLHDGAEIFLIACDFRVGRERGLGTVGRRQQLHHGVQGARVARGCAVGVVGVGQDAVNGFDAAQPVRVGPGVALENLGDHAFRLGIAVDQMVGQQAVEHPSGGVHVDACLEGVAGRHQL